MSEAIAYKAITTHELISTLQRYQSDKARSSTVEERWLCTVLDAALTAACEVGNCRLSEENRKDVNAFRAVELEREIERQRKATENLERELKKVRAA